MHMVAYAPMRERVFITGIGCISPFGIGMAALADALASGAPGVIPITAFDHSSCHSHQAALIQRFDPAAFIPPLKLRRIDAVGRLALACARLLFDDAGSAPGNGSGDDVGVSLGTSSAGLDSIVEYLKGLTDHGPTGVPALIFSNTVSNAAASLCAIEYALRGPNVTFNQREASSLAAIAYAAGMIGDGQIGSMVSGGVDRVDETFFKVIDRFRALSPMRGHARGGAGCSEEAARPFDRRHNGFVLGEGGFVLLLESEGAAGRRHLPPYGELLGMGMTASTTPANHWPTDGTGLARAMRMAIAEAGRTPDEIAAVFATANGSPRLDRLEACAIEETFGDRRIPVVSLKGALGDCGASGAAAVVAGLAAAARGELPPTAGFAVADPACRVHVSAGARPFGGDIFLVNSVASGGTNCSVVVRALDRRS
jgi:3-oxoacyl-[acyl-carrier-protein] synthase II